MWFSVWSALRWIVQHPRMSQSSTDDEGTTFENLWVHCEFICMHLHNTVYVDLLVTINFHNFKINCSLILCNCSTKKSGHSTGNAFTWPYIRCDSRTFSLCYYSEPDSTYFELPQAGHSGEGWLPAACQQRDEVCMDVYHMRDMRDMNDNVMVRSQWRIHRVQIYKH